MQIICKSFCSYLQESHDLWQSAVLQSRRKAEIRVSCRVFALRWTKQVETLLVAPNNRFYKAYVNIQRLRVLAYAFEKSENYPSKLFEIRYQSLSLNLPADDSWCRILWRGSNGIFCWVSWNKDLSRKGRDFSVLYLLAWQSTNLVTEEKAKGTRLATVQLSILPVSLFVISCFALARQGVKLLFTQWDSRVLSHANVASLRRGLIWLGNFCCCRAEIA